MSELGQKDPRESGTSKRGRSNSALRAKRPAASNGQSLPVDSLRPVDGIDHDVLLNLAGFWLRRLQISVMKSFEKHLSDLQARPVDAAALILLQNNDDLTQNALAGALGTDQSTMVGISTRLEERGLIERRRHSNDRRYQVLSLTAAGRKMTTLIKKRLIMHNENVLRNLSIKERNLLFTLLVKIVE